MSRRRDENGPKPAGTPCALEPPMRVLALLVLAATALAGDGADLRPWAKASEFARGHYVVRTNAYPELADSLLDVLDEAYVLYEDRFGPLEAAARRPMRLALFRNRRDYLEHGDGVEGAVGHFDAAIDRCSIVWRGGTGDTGWPVVVHEACHQYFRRRFPVVQPPSWYSEGIACWFEGLLDGTTKRRVARLRIRAAKAALEAGEADLGRVLAAQARVTDGELRLERFKPSRFYGLAWSLCHFLAGDADTRDGFRRFELRLFAARPLPSQREALARRILEEECGPLGELEERWRVHVRDLPEPPAPSRPPVYAWELRSPHAFVRFSAIARLDGNPLPSDLRPGLRRCLRDADIAVRTAAARILALHMDADAVPGMIAAIDAGDPELKSIALKALACRDATAAVPRLLDEKEERDLALRALATIGDPRTFPTLRRALRDPLLDARTRSACAAALVADPDARHALHEAAADDDTAVRSAARVALARSGKADRVEQRPAARLAPGEARRLLDTLRDPSAPLSARRLACRRLGAARASAAVPLLRRLCGPEWSDALRLAAVRALVKITGETRGFEPGQPASKREAAYRAWVEE
jgi:hypothetical protein